MLSFDVHKHSCVLHINEDSRYWMKEIKSNIPRQSANATKEIAQCPLYTIRSKIIFSSFAFWALFPNCSGCLRYFFFFFSKRAYKHSLCFEKLEQTSKLFLKQLIKVSFTGPIPKMKCFSDLFVHIPKSTKLCLTMNKMYNYCNSSIAWNHLYVFEMGWINKSSWRGVHSSRKYWSITGSGDSNYS